MNHGVYMPTVSEMYGELNNHIMRVLDDPKGPFGDTPLTNKGSFTSLVGDETPHKNTMINEMLGCNFFGTGAPDHNVNHRFVVVDKDDDLDLYGENLMRKYTSPSMRYLSLDEIYTSLDTMRKTRTDEENFYVIEAKWNSEENELITYIATNNVPSGSEILKICDPCKGPNESHEKENDCLISSDLTIVTIVCDQNLSIFESPAYHRVCDVASTGKIQNTIGLIVRDGSTLETDESFTNFFSEFYCLNATGLFDCVVPVID